MLSIRMQTRSIKDVNAGNLIAYETGSKFGIKMELPAPSKNIGFFSLSEKKPILCLDDFGDLMPGFEAVIDFGNDFWFAVESKPKLASHISEVDPGVLIIKGDRLYFAHTVVNFGSKACRGVQIDDGRSIHGDAIGYGIALVDQWTLKVAPTRGDESVALLSFVSKSE